MMLALVLLAAVVVGFAAEPAIAPGMTLEVCVSASASVDSEDPNPVQPNVSTTCPP